MPAGNPLSLGSVLRALPRAFDDQPLWAQLNVTWRCNLDCAYCTEYDNGKGHVPYEDVARSIDKCHELGVMHTDLIGGEPLLHPDLERMFAQITRHGMTSGMTTNGFLLTAARLDALIAAGLGRLQISVDRATPRPGTPKSLKTLRRKIDLCVGRPIWFRVNTVLCDDTLDDVEEVARYCFDRGVPVNFSVAHERGRLRRRLDNRRYLDKLAWLRQEKQAGRPVATPYFLLDYYVETLNGRPPRWSCRAGQKCFYVSPEGRFHFCYHVPAVADFASVTPADLARWAGPKGCERDCGVDCVIHTSMPFSSPATVVASEGRGRLGAMAGAVRRLPLWPGHGQNARPGPEP
jgi:MoaA/NifB/PqqE/SkfB family radical SAM enzyme